MSAMHVVETALVLFFAEGKGESPAPGREFARITVAPSCARGGQNERGVENEGTHILAEETSKKIEGAGSCAVQAMEVCVGRGRVVGERAGVDRSDEDEVIGRCILTLGEQASLQE